MAPQTEQEDYTEGVVCKFVNIDYNGLYATRETSWIVKIYLHVRNIAFEKVSTWEGGM